MGERDPFGREVGEDTLTGLRGEDAAPPGPAPSPTAYRAPTSPGTPARAPVQAPPSTSFQTPSSSPPVRPQRPTSLGGQRRAARSVRTMRVILGIVGVVVALSVIGSISNDVHKIHVPKIHIPQVTVPKISLPKTATSSVPSTSAPTPGEAHGLGRGSLLRPALLRRALARIAAKHAGRIKVLRVAPSRVDATLIDGRGRLHQIQVADAGHSITTFSVTSANLPREGTLPIRAIDARAPARLVRAAARRGHVPLRRIDYVAAIPTSLSPLSWSAFFRGGTQWLGDAHGRGAHRLG